MSVHVRVEPPGALPFERDLDGAEIIIGRAPTAGLVGGLAVLAVTAVVWSLSPLRDYRSAHAERLVDAADPAPA